jgi:outer membrane protein assembly factor BamB
MGLGTFATAQDVLTWHNDNARTGKYLSEAILTPQNVNPKTFGKLFVINVDGKVDAEPLYVHQLEIPHRGLRNVLVVATEHDSLDAFDADTGEQFWHVSLLKDNETPSDNQNCGQVSPEIGITSTPVIDRHFATPSISANRSRNAILWAVENVNPAVLHAYDATDLLHEQYNSNEAPSGRDHFGAGNKFITLMIANGKVYVGTTNGVGVFGLLQRRH